MMTTVITVLNNICRELAALYPDKTTQSQHAWWILEHVTKQSQTMLFSNPVTFTKEMQDHINRIIIEHVHNHKPLAYIIGSVPFIDCTILVQPPVLIPRMETEEWVSRLIHTLQAVPSLALQPLSILDLCAGSGCIALALAKAFPLWHITAIDIQPHAIDLIEKNSVHNNIHNVTVLQSDLFQQLERKAQFDLIVSNPPYITPNEYGALDASVSQWEDPIALYTADNGLAIIKRIIKQAPAYLRSCTIQTIPQLILEIGHSQANAVKTIMEQEHYNDIQIEKDCAQKDRIVMGRVDSCGTEKQRSNILL